MTSLYNNVGGSRKTISSCYANIDAVQKQLFPTYTWQRYNVVTDYTESTISGYNYSSYAIYLGSNGGTVYIAHCYYGHCYRYTDSLPYDKYEIGSESETVWEECKLGGGYSLYDSYTASGQNEYVAVMNTKSRFSNYMIYLKSGSSITVTLNTSTGYINITGYGDHIKEIVKTESCGTTYYGTVSSGNISAYPSNGAYGSYWYILI